MSENKPLKHQLRLVKIPELSSRLLQQWDGKTWVNVPEVVVPLEEIELPEGFSRLPRGKRRKKQKQQPEPTPAPNHKIASGGPLGKRR